MAPMAGITDRAFREIVMENGADLAFTEMVNVKGLYYGDENTKKLLDIEGASYGVQIFGRDKEIIKKVIIDDLNHRENISVLDFNMGCPAPKIYKNREGSYLMQEPVLAGEILETMVKYSRFPVTVKFRKGIDKDHINFLEIGKIAENSGVVAVTIHGRTREDFYSGQADWDAIRELKSALKIEVIANGDIFTGQDAKKMIEYTGCESLMIARGALGNPFIFSDIKNILKEEEPIEHDFDERHKTLISHYKKLINYKEEKVVVREMRKHVAWYLKGLRGSNPVKDKINHMDNIDEIFDLLEEYRQEMKENEGKI